MELVGSFLAGNYAFMPPVAAQPSSSLVSHSCYQTITLPVSTSGQRSTDRIVEFSDRTRVDSHQTTTPSTQTMASTSCRDSNSSGQTGHAGEVKFSIDRILGLTERLEEAETKPQSTIVGVGVNERANVQLHSEDQRYSWLQCTRYKPPKLQRMKKKDTSKKRKLGRNPRVPFTQAQVSVLEDKFSRSHYLSSLDVAELSLLLNLTENRVKIWFQNRRARERREREGKLKEGPGHGQRVDPALQTTPGLGKAWTLTTPSSLSAVAKFHQSLELGAGSAFTPVQMLSYKTHVNRH